MNKFGGVLIGECGLDLERTSGRLTDYTSIAGKSQSSPVTSGVLPLLPGRSLPCTHPLTHRNSRPALQRFDKRRYDVAENQRVVILSSLVIYHSRISPIGGIELVLPSIRNPACGAKEESLNGNDVDGVDRAVQIHISSRQSASRKESSDYEEMPLDGDHIHGVNACRTWRQSRLRWRHRIVPARRQRRKCIVAGAVGQYRAPCITR